MIIRAYWPQCDEYNRTEPIDSFWVEATYEEAKKAIFPFLTPEAIECSKTHALDASRIDNPPHPYCTSCCNGVTSGAGATNSQ